MLPGAHHRCSSSNQDLMPAKGLGVGRPARGSCGGTSMLAAAAPSSSSLLPEVSRRLGMASRFEISRRIGDFRAAERGTLEPSLSWECPRSSHRGRAELFEEEHERDREFMHATARRPAPGVGPQVNWQELQVPNCSWRGIGAEAPRHANSPPTATHPLVRHCMSVGRYPSADTHLTARHCFCWQ